MTQGHITTRQAGKVAIVDLSGSITVAGGTRLLRCTIKDLVASGHKNVLSTAIAPRLRLAEPYCS
jgi:hypothetical protein